MASALTPADGLRFQHFYFFEQLVDLSVSVLVIVEFLNFREPLRYIEIKFIRKRSLDLCSIAP